MSLSEIANVILVFLGILFLALIILSIIQSVIERILNRRKFNQAPAVIENPPLNLWSFGIEEKEWNDNTHTVHAFIEVSSPGASFMNTYPTITWTNEQGAQLDKNNGRWFISNDDMVCMKNIELLSVDLESNGKPRKLHFSTNNKERKLYSWWRTPDNRNTSKLITDSPAYVMIFLKASNGPTALYRFRVTHSSDMLKLERLNNKGGVHGTPREFRYTQLPDYENKEDNNVIGISPDIRLTHEGDKGFYGLVVINRGVDDIFDCYAELERTVWSEVNDQGMWTVGKDIQFRGRLNWLERTTQSRECKRTIEIGNSGTPVLIAEQGSKSKEITLRLCDSEVNPLKKNAPGEVRLLVRIGGNVKGRSVNPIFVMLRIMLGNESSGMSAKVLSDRERFDKENRTINSLYEMVIKDEMKETKKDEQKTPKTNQRKRKNGGSPH